MGQFDLEPFAKLPCPDPEAGGGQRVTVGMPVLQNAETVARAIRSVQAQTFEDWTLVASDDGSTDGTAAICEELAADDPRITVVRQPSNLLYMNFGFVLARARTPFFAWLAGDDFWHPTFLAACLAALEENPEAVSALPRCAFVRGGAVLPDPPDTTSLVGSAAERAAAFLDRPNGTRMYGLFRTPVLQRAIPSRNMHAWDWALMLAVLRAGPQLGVDRVLMTRSKSDWQEYSRSVRALYRSRIFRALPVLDATLYVLGRGTVPLSAPVLRRLASLNLAKHEEYVFVMAPELHARFQPLYRRAGLRFASSEPAQVALGRRLLEEATNPRATRRALRVLEATAAAGVADADLLLAGYWASADRFDPARAGHHLRRAARGGRPDALARLIELEVAAGRIAPGERARLHLEAAAAGSHAAAVEVGELVASGRAEGLDAARVRRALEAAAAAGRSDALAPLARCGELGIGGPADRARALRLFRMAAAKRPREGREVARLLLAEGRPETAAEGMRWLGVAAASGSARAQRELGRLELAGDADARRRALAALLEAGRDDAEIARQVAEDLEAFGEPELREAAARRLAVEPERLAELGALPPGEAMTPLRLIRLWRTTRPA